MFKPQKLKILFISHESSVSGAPVLLLNLLKLLKRLEICSFIIVVKRGGVLDNYFAELGETIVLKPTGYQINKSIAGKCKDYFFYRRRLQKIQKKLLDCDCIFSNTVANGRLLKILSNCNKPVITYVHELNDAMKFCDIHKDTTLSLNISEVFFSPVNAVASHLTKSYQIPTKRIHQLNYYFDPVKEDLQKNKEPVKIAFLKKFNIPPNKFYVAGMGVAAFRKGIDLFIKICREVTSRDKNIHFVWIGDFIEEKIKNEMTELIKMENAGDFLTITGFIPNAIENLLPFDVFALTSREDPYPLVMLEAAYCEIATISFSGKGGMDTFINDDTGFLVPDDSIILFAEKIIELKNNPNLLLEKGINAKNKVMKLHSDESIIVQQFFDGIQALNIKN